MDILIVAATGIEVKPIFSYLEKSDFILNNHQFRIVTGGIGCLATSFTLLKEIYTQRPGLIIQAGIGGTFNNPYSLGEVVAISSEILADLGAAENGGFNDIFDLGLIEENECPFQSKALDNPHIATINHISIPMATGITVNEISTAKERIELLEKKYKAQTESMEGAALHYIGIQEKIPFIQIRGISNYIGERDKSKWMLKPAIDNLNKVLIRYINSIPF
jgi:futalosine hydrolase